MLGQNVHKYRRKYDGILSGNKRDGQLIYIMTWMDLKGIILSENVNPKRLHIA